MKGLCYIVLILGFLIFFQQNPLYAIITIVIFAGVFLFFKSRSSSNKGGLFKFFGGAQAQQDGKINDLIMLMMIQQLLNPNDDRNDRNNRPKYSPEFKKRKEKDHIDKLKQEVFEILDEE